MLIRFDVLLLWKHFTPKHINDHLPLAAMDALEISYRLKRLGMTQSGIAKQLGVSTSVVGNVIHDRVTAYQIAQYIAQLLGQDISDLWPNRYCFKPRGSLAQRKGRMLQSDSIHASTMLPGSNGPHGGKS